MSLIIVVYKQKVVFNLPDESRERTNGGKNLKIFPFLSYTCLKINLNKRGLYEFVIRIRFGGYAMAYVSPHLLQKEFIFV